MVCAFDFGELATKITETTEGRWQGCMGQQDFLICHLIP